jgi:uncharacterized membrane protein
MKKIILVHGLIAGIISVLGYVITTAIGDVAMENAMIYGYTSIILGFSLIFVAIRNYREKTGSGAISFGKAFLIGLYISLIASAIYISVWLYYYYNFFPDFAEKYAAQVIKQLQAAGETAAVIEEKRIEMAEFSKNYKNPFFNAVVTSTEILPLGIIISLISAAILKRKPKIS